ncbi:hypothetical protein MKW98_028288 [Papaver atlanticum]|uniref:Uncharacterized protein n=1 Tax=Papaver atlanticum TaxID=357466 RepID=A0AAD4SVZ7_9MAGN|nr:hypothetical protein MKW98_028288 [Papaver atlanticum]
MMFSTISQVNVFNTWILSPLSHFRSCSVQAIKDVDDVLTMETGIVQNSPPNKSVPESGPCIKFLGIEISVKYTYSPSFRGVTCNRTKLWCI